MSMTELAAYAGLAAVALLTLNILLGILLSTQYNPLERWPRRNINVYQLHNWTGYVALAIAVMHPTLLVISPTAGFRIIDVLVPLRSPGQDIENTVGALALYGIAFVVVSSFFRERLGRGRWKAMHYVSYAAGVLFFVHAIFTDPNLQNPAFDPFDAEKIFVEACLLAVLGASAMRVRYALRHVVAPPQVRMTIEPPGPGTGAERRAVVVPLSAPPLGWAGYLRVGGIFRETRDVQTFRLVSPNGGDLAFEFRAGQFLNLAVDIAGQRLRRSYTIASSPAQRRHCEITVKAEELGALSQHLHHGVGEGDVIEVEGPFGDFTFRESEPQKTVMVGGGVGVTPLMSMIRSLADECWRGEIVLLYASRTPDDFVFRTELEELGRRQPRLLRTVLVATQVDDPSWPGLRGRLTPDAIARAVPDVARLSVYICGPPAMMAAVTNMLGELGVPPQRIRSESFGAGVPGIDAARVSLPGALHVAPLVTFIRSQKSARGAASRTILELAEQLRLPIRGGCRIGACGSCRVRLLSGDVSMDAAAALTQAEKAGGVVLACQARPLSDVTVDA